MIEEQEKLPIAHAEGILWRATILARRIISPDGTTVSDELERVARVRNDAGCTALRYFDKS